MDKVTRVIQGANGVLTSGKKYSQNLTLDQTIWEEEKEKGRKERKKGEKKKA